MRLPFLNHKSKKGRIKNMKIQRDGKEYTLTAEEVMEAHEEFVTSFMVAELENSYDVPHKYSKDLAKEAYDMYADSSIYSEYDCIERVAKDYQDRCKEPTVTITWSECNDFEDGEVKKLRSSFNCRKTKNREEELKQESAVAGLTLEEYITQKYIFKCQKTVNKHTKCSQKRPII